MNREKLNLMDGEYLFDSSIIVPVIPKTLDFGRFLWRKKTPNFIENTRRSYGYACVFLFVGNLFSHQIESAKPKRPGYITLGELYYGANKSQNTTKRFSELNQLERLATILDANKSTSLVYGRIKDQLHQKGTPIPENDDCGSENWGKCGTWEPTAIECVWVSPGPWRDCCDVYY